MENHSFELSYRRIKKNLDYLKNKSVDADKIKEINNVLFKIESSVKKINDLESELRQSYDRLNDVLTKSDELIDKKSKKGVDHSEVYQMPDETKLNDVNPGGASILVYCKNMNIGTSVARRLLKKKYEVLSVSELDNAIPIIQATSIDLCIFEIDDENIYIFEDFQNKIRNIHQSSKIPLILLISTDFSKQSHDLIARYPNIFDTIRKPVPPDMLEQKIELAFIQKHKNDHLEKATQRDRILTTQVNTDRLTKLYNRTFFEQEMMRMIKSNQHFYLVYADLDHFKPVNDSYGHVAGDWLLCQVAHRLKNAVRINDYICRLGGDEFAIIMEHDKNSLEIEKFMNRIIDKMSEPFSYEGDLIYIGVSLGVASCPDDAKNFEDLVSLADKAMYVSKNAGRNRYTFHDTCASL